MFGQPRCREWTPLATQQLRLRSLIQIVGYNIHDAECCQDAGGLYYTLHATSMSAPFYTSEKLLSIHPKWREIDSESIQKMSAHGVVVRVWRHSLSKAGKNDPQSKHQNLDTIVQTWGVNFSGLLHIGANLSLHFTPKSFKSNTLVFQMIGGYFCSYQSLRLESATKGIPNFDIGTDSVADIGKGSSPSRNIKIDSKNVVNSARMAYVESKSVSPSRSSWKKDKLDDKFISKSQSPPGVSGFRQNFATATKNIQNLNTSSSRYEYGRSHNSDRSRYDSHSSEVIYEHSPKNEFEIKEYSGSDGSDVQKSPAASSVASREIDNLDIEESETAENFDSNTLQVPKCRYSMLNFLKSEVRPSYTAEKLQKLHQLQYSIKKRSMAVQEIKEKIYQKCALENCEGLSPEYNLAENEDFSRSERLSISCREFSLISGKNKCTSRSKSSGKNLWDGNSYEECDRWNFFESLDGKNELREGRGTSLPPDKRKDVNNLRKNMELSTLMDRRFTLPLNKLLEFKTQPSPSQRMQHARLTRYAELSRFKRRLLQDERDAANMGLRKLREMQAKLFEENQDISTELMQKYHSLSKKSDQLKELKKSESALRELWARSAGLLYARRWRLVQDIQLIYPITEEEEGKLSILGIHLPPCKDTTDRLEQCSEAALAVALGRAAHATALAAGLLAIPLQHPLRLMGSRTKLIDQLAERDNEIALFARNKDSMMFRYGLFLLNKNIGQLLWAAQRFITPHLGDMLANLRILLTKPATPLSLDTSRMFGSVSSMETGGYILSHPMSAPMLMEAGGGSSGSRSEVGAIRRRIAPHQLHNNTRQFNRFKDSVEGHSPKSVMVVRRHRYSRSVGSYIDEQNLQSIEMSPSVRGSEPSLLSQDHPQSDPQMSDLDNTAEGTQDNIQNMMSFSESDLTKVTDIVSPESCSSVKDLSPRHDGKVVFSLGDDSQTPEDSDNVEKTEKSCDINDSTEASCSYDYSKHKKVKRQISRISEERFILSKSLENDVNKLIDDIAGLYCENPGSELSEIKMVLEGEESIVIEERDECIENSVNGSKRCLDFVDSANSSTPEDCQNSSLGEFPALVSLSSSEQDFLISKSEIDNVQLNPDLNDGAMQKMDGAKSENKSLKSPCVDKAGNAFECDLQGSCCDVEIEKLGYPPFCGKPCAENCPRLTGDMSELHTGYDQCENGEEIMHDVIVLPSAEAVMTASSHFTDSPEFLDLHSVEEGLELHPGVLESLDNQVGKSGSEEVYENKTDVGGNVNILTNLCRNENGTNFDSMKFSLSNKLSNAKDGLSSMECAGLNDFFDKGSSPSKDDITECKHLGRNAGGVANSANNAPENTN